MQLDRRNTGRLRKGDSFTYWQGGGRGGKRRQNIRGRKSLVVYNTLDILWQHLFIFLLLLEYNCLFLLTAKHSVQSVQNCQFNSQPSTNFSIYSVKCPTDVYQKRHEKLKYHLKGSVSKEMFVWLSLNLI